MIHIRTFQNYHRHSVYTNVRITDSTVSNEEYAKRANELGHGIISTVEHGWQGRYIEGYELAKKYNLKFVFGTEAYWVKDRFEKERTNCHIILLAKNENGRKAINKALSEANVTGFHYQPRLDIDLLLSLPPKDIICTSSCIAYWRYEDIDEITFLLSNHFENNFFLEVQYHNTDKQKELNKHILELSESYGIEIIMGCDSHFIFPEQENERINYLNSRGLFYEDEEGWYLDYPDGDTAYQRFIEQGILTEEQIDRAMNNTNILLEIEEYDSDIFKKEIKMPTIFPQLTKEEKDKMLENIIMKEWEKEKLKIPKEKWDLYESEIKKELDIVFVTNHSDYFLDDYYIIKKAKEIGGVITPTARGSGGSFIINKYLGFTKIDRISSPVKLFPERFMSATRILEAKTLADFDVNTANPEVFAKAQEIVFGKGKTAKMISFGTLKPKAAWKMYARAQKIDFEIANSISEQLDRAEFALKHLSDEEKEDLDKQEFISSYIDKKYQSYYLESLKYQGIISDWKEAPCGYLLYNNDISEEIGMVVIKSGKKETFCCCMDGKWAEDYKFLKNDLLKVAVVDLIDKVFKRINREIPDVDDLLNVTRNDEKVWDVYKKCITMGINQVEQKGTSHRVGVYAPRNVSEICAFVAAIRPGFKSMYKTFEKREKFEYGIKSLDDLIQTPEMPQSFLLYQETQMAVLNYAGIDMAECYEIIKNIAKKRVEKVLKYKDLFIDGFTKRMIEIEGKTSEEAKVLSDKIWKILEDSSLYAFNAAHSIAVAIDSLYGAYLKANYTIYFYECFMKLLEESGDKDRLNMAKQEAQDYYNIKFPMFKFGQDNRAIIANPEKNEILNSLRTLKGFGKNVAEELYRLGQKKVDNFLDLLYNILGTSINSRQLEILVKIDYFTEYFGINSKTQMEIINALYMFNDGQSKQMAIKNIDENSVLESIIKRNSRATDKTYMDLNTRKILEEYQQYLISSETKDFTVKEKIVFQQEYLGYIAFQTNNDEDRTKLVVTGIVPLKTKDKTRVWAYRLSTISIGTGKQSDSIKVFASTFDKNPLSKTDVIYVRPQNIKKDEYNGEMQYWLNGYTIIDI